MKGRSTPSQLSAEIDIAQHRNQSLMTGFRWRDANGTIRTAHLGLINIQQKSGADMDRVGLLLLLPMALTTSIEAGEITGNLIRAARVLIDWSVENLAEASGVNCDDQSSGARQLWQRSQ